MVWEDGGHSNKDILKMFEYLLDTYTNGDELPPTETGISDTIDAALADIWHARAEAGDVEAAVDHAWDVFEREYPFSNMIENGLSHKQMVRHIKKSIKRCQESDLSPIADTEHGLSGEIDEALYQVFVARRGLQEAIENVWAVFNKQFPDG